MTKSKNSDLESNNVKANVLEKSKKIKKDKKKGLEDKKKLQQAVTKNNESHTAPSNGSPEAGAIVKNNKPKKNKSKKNKVTDNASPKDSGDKPIEPIDKKKAKKLAKKLKKKEKKEAKKDETAKQAPKGNGNVLKSKSQLEKGDKSEGNKETKEHDQIKAECTIFVGNLPVNTKRVQLIRLFQDYGPVNGIRFRSANGKILFKHKHRKEAGTLSAWIVLKDPETVTRALALNGTAFKNNHLRVTRGDVKSSDMDTKRTVFVGNLKYSANEEKLREIFSACGDIDYVRCLNDDKGCKGVAYVCFKAPEAVGLALELNETVLDERPIHVERYSVKKLGAKKTRDVTEVENKKKSSGAKTQKDKAKKVKGDNPKTKQGSDTNKKSKFRGVKVDGTQVKKQKKKVTSQMQKLAKKIAPKEKS